MVPDSAMNDTTALQAAAFRRLLRHLNEERTDVQNIDLMILAGFCRNCLADWYREAALESGQDMDKAQAREAIYGMPFERWKQQHQREATPEQLAAFEQAQRRTHPT
ncbi:MAG TPA: DUF1244 domain-containing protein [Stenotrophomonas sp.]